MHGGVLIAAVALSSAGSGRESTAFEGTAVASAPDAECVAHWTEARFVGVAYHHIVHVANGCSVPLVCSVRTNVNPDAQVVTVPSGTTVEVLTFMGSPASAFTATVQCVRQPAARFVRFFEWGALERGDEALQPLQPTEDCTFLHASPLIAPRDG
jgi:hypothetical protein